MAENFDEVRRIGKFMADLLKEWISVNQVKDNQSFSKAELEMIEHNWNRSWEALPMSVRSNLLKELGLAWQHSGEVSLAHGEIKNLDFKLCSASPSLQILFLAAQIFDHIQSNFGNAK